jgi:RNA polymerase-binding transcription factor DksA
MAPSKKEPGKKTPTTLVKPRTRSTSRPFTSDSTEVKNLIHHLDEHLAKHVTDEEILETARTEIRQEIQKIAKELDNEETTYGKVQP